MSEIVSGAVTVLDHTGDTTHVFSSDDPASIRNVRDVIARSRAAGCGVVLLDAPYVEGEPMDGQPLPRDYDVATHGGDILALAPTTGG